jgi:hypothetical protein
MRTMCVMFKPKSATSALFRMAARAAVVLGAWEPRGRLPAWRHNLG